MARECVVTGKKPMVGNNVSHAQNKTKRRFIPNIQETNLYSETLKRSIRLRISAAGLRTLDHKGGLDAYVRDTASTKLHKDLRGLKAQIDAAETSK